MYSRLLSKTFNTFFKPPSVNASVGFAVDVLGSYWGHKTVTHLAGEKQNNNKEIDNNEKESFGNKYSFQYRRP